VLVCAGGIIPPDDVDPVRQMGIKGVFGPGTSMEEVVRFIRANVRPEAGAGA
jgi:methylmalonyl-CoA mutase C-terminal domain/subunit